MLTLPLTLIQNYDRIQTMTIIKPIPKIEFDRMHEDDLQQVMCIEEEAFPDPWHISFFKREIQKRKKNTHLYVGRLNDQVIGYIVFYTVGYECHILNIAVETTYRRRGVGKYLLECTFENIKKNKVKEIFLEVSVKNTAALELYRKYGFQVFGVRKKYYSNGDDAYVLRKEMQYVVS